MSRPRPQLFDKKKTVAENRRARFDYEIDTVYEAGIALTGTEVKSLRFGEGSITESYADVRDGQVWLINSNVPEFSHGNRFGHDEYSHYYWAQALYILGDDGYAKLFPDSKERDRLTWSKYRKTKFDQLVKTQNAEGYWTGGYIGPIFTTTVYLTILQLDNGTLPIYQK
jgi:hypothetical protein